MCYNDNAIKQTFYFIQHIRRYFMKYEVPVCEMIKLCIDDVITTSVPFTPGEGEIPPYGDGPVGDIDGNTTGGTAY